MRPSSSDVQNRSEPLNVWLFNPYGTIPGEPWRPYRFTLLARALTARGHRVTWWTSSFSHHFKKQRCTDWTDIAVADSFTIRLVPTPSYSSHTGLRRVWRDIVFARRASKRATSEEAPSLVVSAENPIAMGWAGPRVARFHGVPYVCDVFDLWPELFRMLLPSSLRRFDRFLFAPLYASRRRTWGDAAGIVSLCDSYLAAAIRETARVDLSSTCVIYNGTDVPGLRLLLNKHLPTAADAAGNEPIRALFSGTLGANYDIPTLLQAAERYRTLPNGRPLRFVVAGDGPLRGLVEAAAARNEIDYLGTLGPSQLAKAYAESDIGLISYRHESNVGIPDKFYDYLAAGLPVVSSLREDVASLISKWQLGECYRPGDPTDLVAAIGRITEDSEAMRATAMRAWTKAEAFDQEAQYSRYAEFLERLTYARRHDRP